MQCGNPLASMKVIVITATIQEIPRHQCFFHNRREGFSGMNSPASEERDSGFAWLFFVQFLLQFLTVTEIVSICKPLWSVRSEIYELIIMPK